MALNWPGRGEITPDDDGRPDLAVAAGTEPPDERPLDGINLLPILQGKEPPAMRALFWRTNQEFPVPSRQRKAE